MKTLNYSLKGFLIISFFAFGSFAFANNILVSNISLEDMNESQNYVMVEFDVSWENSWRISAGPNNWDAAWIIIKYRTNGGDWGHAILSTSGAVAPSGSTVDVSPDNMGAMIYRSTDGSGNVDYENVRLRWDYGTSVHISDMIDVQVFGMEMVYVPEGAFYLGNYGGSEINRIHAGGDENLPYHITSENAITVSNSAGNLFYLQNGTIAIGDGMGPIPTDFPKGFQAFYCLKYELSQSQWVNFFNTLNPAQKVFNDITAVKGDVSDSRNSISWLDSGDATTTTPFIPMTYIKSTQVLSFLDWAGLRPMTELEYVKACKGPLNPINDEFAWGTTNIKTGNYTYSNLDESNESINNLLENSGNAIYASTDSTPYGPKRNGIFAASSSNHTRQETGSSYYGIMEMSGNVVETVIKISNGDGRNFSGLHGDGELTTDGQNNVNNWIPNGIGGIGGSYPYPKEMFALSSRDVINRSFLSSFSDVSIRGVRTAF